MKLYVEGRALRHRQLAVDLALGVWCAAWVAVGTWVHDLLGELARPGLAARDAGEALSDIADRGGSSIEDLPLIGDALAAPLDAIAEGGRALAVAGAAQARAARSLALWLSLLLVLVPVVLLFVPAIRWRIRTMTRARAAARLREHGAGPELFALRALASRPLEELQRVHRDPFAAFTQGRYHDLARLELEALGLVPRDGDPWAGVDQGRD